MQSSQLGGGKSGFGKGSGKAASASAYVAGATGNESGFGGDDELRVVEQS